MIVINNFTLPSTRNIGRADKYIGVVGDNDYEVRVFQLPKIYNGKDISEDYVFTLEVHNSEDAKYINALDMSVHGDYIYLFWTIKNHDCVEGTLRVLIKAQSSTGDIIKQTYPLEFECVAGINAAETAAEIPPSIYEQAIAHAAKWAKEAKDAADSIFDLLSDYVMIPLHEGTIENPVYLSEVVTGLPISLKGVVSYSQTSLHSIDLSDINEGNYVVYTTGIYDEYILLTAFKGLEYYLYKVYEDNNKEPELIIKLL